MLRYVYIIHSHEEQLTRCNENILYKEKSIVDNHWRVSAHLDYKLNLHQRSYKKKDLRQKNIKFTLQN